jgi:hypothetical protein
MSKKTETIELRLPYEAKLAFMSRCSEAGVSASAELRTFIADYVDGHATRLRTQSRKRLAVRAGLVVLALAAATAAAQPALARASLSASFAQIDANHDGQVSFAEFSRAVRPQVSLDAGPMSPLAHPGRLSVALEARILRESFDRIDANRDGEISLDEFRRNAER